jgi:hypothetical protein
MLYVYNTQHWIFVNKSTSFFNEDRSNKLVKGTQFSFADRNFTCKKKVVLRKGYLICFCLQIFNVVYINNSLCIVYIYTILVYHANTVHLNDQSSIKRLSAWSSSPRLLSNIALYCLPFQDH